MPGQSLPSFLPSALPVRQVVAHKVYLAVPSDCPLGPDGKKRTSPSKGITGRTVTMYISDADGDDFTEVLAFWPTG